MKRTLLLATLGLISAAFDFEQIKPRLGHALRRRKHDDEPVEPLNEGDFLEAGIVFAFDYKLFDTYKKDMLKYITSELTSYSQVFPDYEKARR